jgi:hypothetical protein
MKTWRAVLVYFHSFLNYAKEGDEWSDLHPLRFTRGEILPLSFEETRPGHTGNRQTSLSIP